MTEKTEKTKSVKDVIDRLEIVTAFLLRDYELPMFVKLYNAGDTCNYLREVTGPIEANDLERWVNICKEVAI